MKIVKGQVVSNVDGTRSGVFMAKFPSINAGSHPVTYTSPFFKANAGGFLAIPEVNDEILAVFNPDPPDDEQMFYYHSTIVSKKNLSSEEENPNFKVIPDNDRQVYGDKSKPVMQHFTNHAGAGLYIHREFTASKISNNVTMRSEGGEEVNVGPVGVQIRNADGDSIILNGAEPNDAYAARSLSIETRGSQQYKCTGSDINMRIVDGGDINIENNSTGLMSLGKWFGNIRLKSRFRNIDLAALGPASHVNIYTLGATIQVDGTGAVKVLAAGNIDFNSAGSINLNGALGVNIFGGANPTGPGVSIGSSQDVAINAPIINQNGVPLLFSAGPPGSDFTNSTPVPRTTGIPALPPVFTPNDYLDPGGSV